MSQHDDPTATDPTEIEALTARLEAGNLSESDTRLVGRLLRLLLKLINLVEQKNSSIKIDGGYNKLPMRAESRQHAAKGVKACFYQAQVLSGPKKDIFL